MSCAFHLTLGILKTEIKGKKLTICTQAQPSSLELSTRITNFIAFPLINVKNHPHIAYYQFNLAAISLVYYYVCGWLVKFWCSRFRDSVQLIV